MFIYVCILCHLQYNIISNIKKEYNNVLLIEKIESIIYPSLTVGKVKNG